MESYETLKAISEKNLAGCYPPFQVMVLDIIHALFYQEGMSFAVHMGLRSYDKQSALYAQGRLPLIEVNEQRRKCGMGPLTYRENENTVTRAKPGKSWHNFGLAADLVEDGDPNQVGIQWSWKNPTNYLKIGKVVKQLYPELTWGGFWKSFVDLPHIEMTGKLTLHGAESKYLHGGLTAVWEAL